MTKPHHILITGASSGLGAALALIYAAPSVRLSLHGRNHERLSKIAERARQNGAIVTLFTGDIRDSNSLSEWISCCDQEDPFDLIIANAGISAGTLAASESPDQVRTIFDTNFYGALNTIEPLLPLFIKRQRGQIVLMSSLASFFGLSGSAAYCASKAALRIYGEALRRQCQPFGIKVNVICPGFIKTPMTDVNRFKMPFLMSADRAALLIKCALEHDKPRIAFPWIMYGFIRFVGLLPQTWLDKLLAMLPKKQY